MMPPDGRRRPKRLDEISEGAQLDDEDLTPRRGPRARHEARPARRQRIEINKIRELLESFEYSRVLLQLDGTGGGEKTLDDAVRRIPEAVASPADDRRSHDRKRHRMTG